MKGVVADAASGGACVNRTSRQVIRTGVDGSTPGEICHNLSVVEPPYPVLFVVVATSPPCGLNTSQHVANTRQSTSPALVGHTPKLDAVVGRKFPNDLNSAPIFSKLIGHKLSNGYSIDLYLRCMMNFTADNVQT